MEKDPQSVLFQINLRNPFEPQKSLSDAPRRPQSVIVAQELTFDSAFPSRSEPPQSGPPVSGPTRPRAAQPRPPQPVTRQVSAPVDLSTSAVNQVPSVNRPSVINPKPNEISSTNQLITLDQFSSFSIQSETSSTTTSGNSVLSEFDPLS